MCPPSRGGVHCRRTTRLEADSNRGPPLETCAPWRHGCARRRVRGARGSLRPVRTGAKAERPDVADSFIVCWQFCLRFGSEVVDLNAPGRSEATACTDKGAPQVCIQFRQRKGCANPDPVSRAPMSAKACRGGDSARVCSQVWRNCVCALQGRRLCGVCAIRRRRRPGMRVFPALTYTEALSYVKITAARLNLPRALEWGTHCFRRGRADQVHVRGPLFVRPSACVLCEALKEGGVPALFQTGGWRATAAFGFLRRVGCDEGPRARGPRAQIRSGEDESAIASG